MPVNKEFQTVLQLRIELQHSKPIIWRTILVPADITLIKLHLAIQYAMGWCNGHLHEFDINGVRYGMVDSEWSFDSEIEDEKRKRLARVLCGRKHFDYVYDIGDYWLHRIKVEKSYPTDKPLTRIICIDGENACPPEDVGGPPGYSDFLDIITDPDHEEHEDMLAWIGAEDFDPTFFNREDANDLLGEIKH